MEHRCNEIEQELNDFQKRYENNGKEVLAMAYAIKDLKQAIEDHKHSSDLQFIEIKSIIQPYADLSATMRVVLWVSKLIIALGVIGGGWLAFKKLLE